MNILVACECSGTVRDAFRRLGHNAWSCDILPDAKASPYHIQCDVVELLRTRPAPHRLPPHWDRVITHPPCTHLAVSGARHFPEKIADGRQQAAIEFFLFFTRLTWEKHRVRSVVIENPVCIMSSVYRKPNQIIEPWQFGHKEMKKTCLWYCGDQPVRPLRPTKIVGPPPKIKDMTPEEKRSWCRIHYCSPGPNRGQERSVFYSGFAEAMALQWGGSPQSPPRFESEYQNERPDFAPPS